MNYLTQAIIYFTMPFIWVLLIGPFFIRTLRKYEFGQNIRQEGPSTHYKKEGIPTMGGILIITGIIIPIIITNSWSLDFIMYTVILLSTAIIGFSDDYIKIIKERSLGLTARQKILLQFIIGLVLGIYVYYYIPEGRFLLIPFLKQTIHLGVYIIPIIVLTYLSVVNAVNLTDGLDGLASSITAVASITLFIFLLMYSKSSYALLALSITGGTLGFLWYNSKPASIFMGDIGSFTLGAALAVLFSYTGLELVLIVVGGIYVIEALSVIIQVIYYKLTDGERIFLMSPLHHHFELKGLGETKIVYRFTLVSILLSALSLIISV